MALSYLITALAAYLLGSIPSGVIVSRAFGKRDVREVESGHTGALNTFRVAGFLPAAFTFLADAGKVVLALEFARAATGSEWGLALAGVAGIYTALLLRQRFDLHAGAEAPIAPREMIANLIAAFKMRELWRWLLLEELADFMLDKLLEVTGLYFHDVVGVSLAAASGAVAVFTIAGLLGDTLLVPALEKVSGLRLLRVTAVIVLAMYVALLLVPNVWLKFVLIGIVGFGPGRDRNF